MNTYPASLPCASRIEGHSQGMDAGLVRTDMQGGNARQRRRYLMLPTSIALTFMIPQKLLAQWVQWVNAHAWGEFFMMRLPGVAASQDGTDTTAIAVRFTSNLQMELQPVHRLWYWRVSVNAEWLPDEALVSVGAWIIGGTPSAPTAQWIVGGHPATPSPEFTTPGTPGAPVVIV